MITKSPRRDSGRITIAAAMALIAMAAMMFASTSTRISEPPLNEILTLFIELILPLYLLVNLERPLSVAKVAAAAGHGLPGVGRLRYFLARSLAERVDCVESHL